MQRQRQVTTPLPTAQPTERQLRWIADAYEQAQQVRVQTGERIRAIVQGREEAWRMPADVQLDPDVLLAEIRKGDSDGPVSLLGRTYRRHWEAEREYAAAMEAALRAHPAWPWLSRVKGMGATLAAKLLARLDVAKAATPSAFWAYCGLATVPGVQYRCAVCGYTSSFPPHYRVSGAHPRLGTGRACEGKLEPIGGPDAGVRVAQPRPGQGERARYDGYAKKVCYLIGTSFLRSGGPYAEHYRREKEHLRETRPGWTPSRIHLGALRKTEKLFLAHLWLVWREAVGLPLTQPYASAVQGQPPTDPWKMIGVERTTTPAAPTASPGRMPRSA